jgi:hypothetical protein
MELIAIQDFLLMEEQRPMTQESEEMETKTAISFVNATASWHQVSPCVSFSNLIHS